MFAIFLQFPALPVRVRDLYPLEKNNHNRLYPDCEKNLYFSNLIRDYNKYVLLLMQRTHRI